MCAVAASVGTCWALYVPNTPSVGTCWAFAYFQHPLQALSSAAPWTKPIPLKLQITKYSAQARAAALKLASARGCKAGAALQDMSSPFPSQKASQQHWPFPQIAPAASFSPAPRAARVLLQSCRWRCQYPSARAAAGWRPAPQPAGMQWWW